MTRSRDVVAEDVVVFLTDTSSLTDAEVQEMLSESGVDVAAARRRFDISLDELFAEHAVLENASGGVVPSPALLRRMEQYVRGLARSSAELAIDIASHGVAVAHRDLATVTTHDLESQLAEVLAIEAAQRGEVE